MSHLTAEEVVIEIQKPLKMKNKERGYTIEPNRQTLSGAIYYKLPLVSDLTIKMKKSSHFSNILLRATMLENLETTNIYEFGYIIDHTGISVVRSAEENKPKAGLILNVNPDKLNNLRILEKPTVKRIDENKEKLFIQKMRSTDPFDTDYYNIVLEKAIEFGCHNINYFHMKISDDYYMKKEEYEELVNLITPRL